MKVRLDQLLVQRGLASSREKAQALVMAGQVLVSGQVVRKPAFACTAETAVELKEQPRFVSRGGEKLAGALQQFTIDVNGLICLDIGSSTGGFTDCLLQHGAARVYAFDVGTGQMDWRLRQDQRVVVREKFNARHLRPEDIPEMPQLAVIDVSFISLKLILPPVVQVLRPDGQIVALIKPQFEAGRDQVGQGGVVRSTAVHATVIREIVDFSQKTLGLSCRGLGVSPLVGPAGNIEFLIWLKKQLSPKK